MVRAGAPPSSTKKKEKDAPASGEDNTDELESKRLRGLSFASGLLSKTRSHAQHPLYPSKTLLKSDGRDIVKKTTRKSKYLFSFPGLMAPVACGKLGDLSNLDSKNPVLYVEFPEGRLKLFGTIVYPKNKYLTLHFQRGSGSVLCEDSFESLVVFSVAWWIGTKEQNPEEARLPLPKSVEEVKHTEFDFTSGAGQASDSNKSKVQKENAIQPISQTQADVSGGEVNANDTEIGAVNQPSMRQSARTAGKQLKYAETSDTGSDSRSSDTKESEQVLKSRGKEMLETSNDMCTDVGINVSVHSDAEDDKPVEDEIGIQMTENSVHSDVQTMSKKIQTSVKKSVKGSINKSTVLKQTRLDAFQKKPVAKDEDLATMVEVLTPKTTSKVAVHKGSAKRGRSRKNSKEEDTEDSCSEGSVKNASKGKKRAKNQGTVGVNKGIASSDNMCDLTISTKTPTTNSKILKEETVKTKKEEKVMKGSYMKGNKRSSVSRSATKRLKMAGNSAVELSDSTDEPSDDSDEDWAS